jgi:putative pyruvate formate lyase activating enzyme
MPKQPINPDSFSDPVRRLLGKMNPCTICPRNCKIDRTRGRLGYCGIADTPKVTSIGPHFGEEPVLVGPGGSGTIFFAGCNLACIFCQNFDISHNRQGRDLTIPRLADAMLQLQNSGCSNINLVTPTHTAAPIAAAIESAKADGLSLPIVYNTGGYDSPQTLDLLNGFIDIYMPDMKYSDPDPAGRLSDAPDYPQVNRAAVRQMHRQVGDLQTENGLAKRGLLVRLLVLPDDLAGSSRTIDFLADEISPSTTINIMAQYHPCYKADLLHQVNRCPTKAEIENIRKYATDKGLNTIN